MVEGPIIYLLERQKCFQSDRQKRTMNLLWCSREISEITIVKMETQDKISYIIHLLSK